MTKHLRDFLGGRVTAWDMVTDWMCRRGRERTMENNCFCWPGKLEDMLTSTVTSVSFGREIMNLAWKYWVSEVCGKVITGIQ